MSTDRSISLVLAAFLVVGLLWAGKTIFLGSLVFLGVWVLIQRSKLLKGLAARMPLLIDAAATVGGFMLLSALGSKSLTLFLATAVACIETSIYVALLHDRRQRTLAAEKATA